ncbi:hypothetical protein [Roseovarius aestuariivivens]|uniref:hypothetical protein n=1 Tax=Roseovarius aestuariivivens TaxID=1888910 RepID=UPI00107FFE3D|nr:hypothetical protein [Roseovarius aestuariivivens]
MTRFWAARGTISDFNTLEGDQIRISITWRDFGTHDTTFIGGAAFTGAGKEVRVTRDPNDFFRAIVSIDSDGDRRTDGHIVVEMTHFFDLPGAEDFVLI